MLIDQFLERAKEAEIDANFDSDDLHIMVSLEHIEPAGIHSGDSSAVVPPYSLGPIVIQQMCEYAERIARALNIKGLINIQFAIKDDHVYVAEANPQASRTTPFIAKAYGVPYLNIATKVMLGTQTQGFRHGEQHARAMPSKYPCSPSTNFRTSTNGWAQK